MASRRSTARSPRSEETGLTAEQALLGVCLVGSGAFEKVASLCAAEDFAIAWHSRVYRAMGVIAGRGDVVELVSVLDELKDTEPKEYGVGSWVVALAELCQGGFSSQGADRYARMVRRNAEQRGHTLGDSELPPKYSHDRAADLFSRAYSESLAYVEARGCWMRYDGHRWVEEKTLQAVDLSRTQCRALSLEAMSDPDLHSAQRGKVASVLCSAPTIMAVERLARADRRHARSADQWDRELLLLNTPGGVVDLRSGQLRAHDPRLHITKSAGIAPGAASTLWRKFLSRVTGGDAEIESFLQRFIGSSLSGLVVDHVFLFLYGRGANGKSTFLNVVQRVLGDYAVAAPMQMFVDNGIERHPTELARLEGARLVVAQEIEEGQRFKLSLLKALTGGDPITARLMRRDFFTYQPQCKLVLAGNHKPTQRHIDEALRRRLCLVPFTQTIPPAERDPDLPAKLWAEAPGILQWAIDGCLLWQEHGLRPPPAVAQATDAYLEDEDVFRQWIEECVERDSLAFTTVAELRSSYQAWSEAMGERFLGVKRFSQALEDHGFQRARGAGNTVRGFNGCMLRQRQGRLHAAA